MKTNKGPSTTGMQAFIYLFIYLFLPFAFKKKPFAREGTRV